MADYEEFKLAHERYMSHEDLFTKWGNAAMLSQTILIAAISQVYIYRNNITDYLGGNNVNFILFVVAFAGLMFSLIWLFVEWRNFYYTIARIEVLRKMEKDLFEGRKNTEAPIFGVLNMEFKTFNDLTSGPFRQTYQAHRKRWGILYSIIGSVVSWVIVRRISTRYQLFLIPLIYTFIWIGALILGIRLASF